MKYFRSLLRFSIIIFLIIQSANSTDPTNPLHDFLRMFEAWTVLNDNIKELRTEFLKGDVKEVGTSTEFLKNDMKEVRTSTESLARRF